MTDILFRFSVFADLYGIDFHFENPYAICLFNASIIL